MINRISEFALTLSALLMIGFPAVAQDIVPTPDDVRVEKRSYSPYVGINYPTRVFWGETHLHTNLSMDAAGFGAKLGPEEAFRFARGEEVVSSNGERLRLSRPLDWLAITDHSDAMGAMIEIIAGNHSLMRDPTIQDWNKRMNAGGETSLVATMDVINAFTQAKLPPILDDPKFQQSIWDKYLHTAEAFNNPGQFTTLIGYEWTSTEDGNNLHRCVIYRDGVDRAKRLLPFTSADSFNPEDLWEWLQRYEQATGGEIFAIAHNGNLSNGIMFPVETNPDTGKPLSDNYAKNRIRWEPLYEVTQIKGDGETHPVLSPDDQFADYETWDQGNLNLSVVKTNDMLQYEYAREALKNGLKLEATLGTNPYKFGLQAATDAHTGLAAVEEENFYGKHPGVEPDPKRGEHLLGKFGDKVYKAWSMAGSGYTGVWAMENTREAVFDALKRKEVYATTGPRMTVWFFGGWNFVQADAERRAPGRIGYGKGVPMGGDLTNAPDGKSPSFLVAALKDPYSGNLDRVQIVKGWLDDAGNTHEKVYNVTWSDADNRKPGSDGEIPQAGNTVDVANATWTNTIGDPELISVWRDPDFDPGERAFYYARVIEIPTPRWTAYDAYRYGVTMDKEVPMTTQERAYTSPIWYTP
jgi:hypothetical protein